MENLSYQLLFILFMTGLFAGFIDAIAGGGGLISLPMLLSVGVPPHVALGTNKVQGSVGTFVAVCNYYRVGLFSFQTIYKGLIFGFLGAMIGANTAQTMSSNILEQIIPILLVFIFLYTLLAPKMGFDDKKPLCSELFFYIVFGFILGFYDGFFGPGTGTFWVFFLTYFLGYNLRKATAYTKIFNLKSNLIAAACFALGGNIDYKVAICMAIGQLLGGQLGAHFAIKNGATLIRPIYMIVVPATIISLFYKNYRHGSQITNFLSSLSMLQLSSAMIAAVIVIFATIWVIRKSTISRYSS